MTIRQATKKDYPAITEVMNSCWPDERTSAEELEYQANTIPSHIKWQEFVMEEASEIIAYADYLQFSGAYHPQKFWAWVFVKPEQRDKGVGQQLFETILTALQPHDPISLRTSTREDQAPALHFIDKWGFKESKRNWESRLDVSTVDLTRYQNVEEKPRGHGIVITTLAELSKTDHDYKEKYYDMWCEARLDVPRADPTTPVTYEQWQQWILDSPYMIPEGTLMAVDKTSKRYVGVSQLLKAADGEHLETGLTGVRRAYRRKGIALAMKIKGIKYAKKINAPEIRTSNESSNRAILSINEMLGYVKQPVWIEFVKTFKEEA